MTDLLSYGLSNSVERIIYEIENDITERYEKKDEIYETTVQSRNDENKNYENSLTSCVSEKPNEFNDPYEGLFVENTVRDPESYELPDVPLIVEEKEVLDEINYKNQAVAKISSLSNDLNMSPLSGTFADFANGRIGVASNNILHSSLHSKMKEYISVQDIRLLKYLTVMQADIFKWRIQKYGYLRENYQLPRTLAIKVNPFWFINIPPVAIYEEFTFCRPDAPLIVLCSLDQLVPSQAIQSNFNATEASFCARDDIMIDGPDGKNARPLHKLSWTKNNNVSSKSPSAQIQLAGRAIAAASIESTQRVHDTNEHHVPNEFNNYEHLLLGFLHAPNHRLP
uniref:Uncharacterized protein n=1 Tax=Plectus sambesii TaxID=2011161 RepID=A0A914X6U3_9BILA